MRPNTRSVSLQISATYVAISKGRSTQIGKIESILYCIKCYNIDRNCCTDEYSLYSWWFQVTLVLGVNQICRFSLSFLSDKILLIYSDDVINCTTNILPCIRTCTQHKIALKFTIVFQFSPDDGKIFCRDTKQYSVSSILVHSQGRSRKGGLVSGIAVPGGGVQWAAKWTPKLTH
jgi:hypothetical protein